MAKKKTKKAAKKRPRGRPPHDVPRNHVVFLRVSASLYDRLLDRRDESGKSLNDIGVEALDAYL